MLLYTKCVLLSKAWKDLTLQESDFTPSSWSLTKLQARGANLQEKREKLFRGWFKTAVVYLLDVFLQRMLINEQIELLWL